MSAADGSGFRKAPLPAALDRRESDAKGALLDLASLTVTATVAMCDVDDAVTSNPLPTISMSIVQCVRLSDSSLISLDMDRGFTAMLHGAEHDAEVSWSRPLDEVVKEVLDLVRADDPHKPAYPWEQLAEAARRRGVNVDAQTLSGLPYEVVLSARAIEVFVG